VLLKARWALPVGKFTRNHSGNRGRVGDSFIVEILSKASASSNESLEFTILSRMR
jgi:hypothetical protein